jgi:hypothetical protein
MGLLDGQSVPFDVIEERRHSTTRLSVLDRQALSRREDFHVQVD